SSASNTTPTSSRPSSSTSPRRSDGGDPATTRHSATAGGISLRPTARAPQRRASRRVVLRTVDQIDHAIAAVEFERKPRDLPHSVFLDRLQKNHARCFRPARRKAQDRRSGCAIESDLAERRAGRDRRAENIGRYGAGLQRRHAEFVSFGMSEGVKTGTDSPAEERYQTQPDNDAPYGP